MNSDQRYEELERRVSQLEQEIDQLKGKTNEYKYNVQHHDIRKDSKQVKEKKPKEEVDWEHLIGRVWLPRIFIFVLLLGVIWGFTAAIDAGFINETVRVVLGYFASIGLLYIGLRQFQKKREALSQVLLAGSVILLMLSTFSANVLYGLISTPIAFVINLLSIGLGIYLSIRLKSEVLAILSAVGGTLVPFLVENVDEPNAIFFTAYEVILYSSFLLVALKQKYVKLFYISALLMHLVFGIFAIIAYGTDEFPLTIGTLIQHIILLIVFILTGLFQKHQSRILFSSFVLTLLWVEVGFDKALNLELVVLTFFAVYSLIAFYLWKKQPYKLTVPLMIASYSLMVYLFLIFKQEPLAILLLIQGVFAFYIGYLTKSQVQRVAGLVIYGVGAFVAWDALTFGIPKIVSIETLIWLIFIGSFYYLGRMITKQETDLIELKLNPVKIMRIFNYLTILWVILFQTHFFLAATQNLSTNVQYLTVSTSWALFAIGAILYGVIKDKKDIRLLGIVLIFVTLGKIVFVDLPEVSIVIRAVLFMGLGGIGVFASRLFYKDK